MIRQGLAFDDILEKKFKILRTSIMLGNLKNRSDALKEYEDTAREIDRIKRSVYEELLASKMYTSNTLEEEQTRLKDLITFIENRVKERNSFLDDYIKITSNFLDGLDKVSYEDEIISYKNRYNNIGIYLDNCNEIKNLNIKLKELRDDLEEKYENKASNELINSKLEEELIDEFNKCISKNSYYSGLNYLDIDSELTKLDESIVEKKSVLDTFSSSYQALVNAGISGAEREEYSSYVQDARINYYEDIEKKCILNIYKLVLDRQNDYDKLYDKRASIDSIFDERQRMRNSLEIDGIDEFDYFIGLCKEQFSIIKSQKFNIENIDKLILEISDCEKRLSELETDNSRAEIVELIDEFSVQPVEVEKVELPDEKQVFEVVSETVERKPSNMVVRIKEPVKINVKTASDIAKLVMKKVVIVLEPKKFGNQRDKLKEAELELAKEKIENENKKKLDEFYNEEINLIEDNEEHENTNKHVDIEKKDDSDTDSFPEVVDDANNIEETEKNVEETEEIIFNTPDIKVKKGKDNITSTFVDGNDIFLDDDMFEDHGASYGFNLDTSILNGNKGSKELTKIRINASDTNDMTIPTEIFIEDTPKQEVDLFKVTDPFLDDNEFELQDNELTDSISANMPLIRNIGTVKPNNALSKIENVVKDSNDVILPNLGLVDGVKSDVPIVSENYIS